MLNEIVIFGHNDCDQLGCMLHIEISTPNIPKINFHTNYQDLIQKTDEVIEYCTQYNPKVLLITDISFSSNKDQLLRLQSLQDKGIKVIFLDHHEYPKDFFTDLTLTYKHDITKSATLITQEFFKTEGLNKNLDVLSKYINMYDIWLNKEEHFETALIINDYFWTAVNGKYSLDSFCRTIIDNNYKLPNDFADFAKQSTIQIPKKIQNYKDRKLIMSDGFFTVAFVDDSFTQILYEEFKKDVQFVFIANSYGITRFRFNNDSYLTRKQKEEIKLKIIGTLENGHLNAFSDKIQNSNFEKIMNRVQEVQTILNKYKRK